MVSFRKLTLPLIVTLALLFTGCGGQNSDETTSNSSESTKSGLTAFQQENGIGPVTEEVDLGEIDKTLAKKGQSLFETKCSACHKMDDRYVGPGLRDVLDQRSPEYAMNMILNPAEMVKKHPEARKLLAEFMTPMPDQNVSRDEARSIVEYFRYMNKNKDVQEIK